LELFGVEYSFTGNVKVKDRLPDWKQLEKDIKNPKVLDQFILKNLKLQEDRPDKDMLIDFFTNLRNGNIYSSKGNDKYFVKHSNKYYTHYHFNGIKTMLGVIKRLNGSVLEIDYVGSKELTIEQNKAVKISLKNRFSCITGGAGTGKTYTAKILLDNLKGNTIILATTGTAAQKLGRELGIPGTTIHNAIGKSITGMASKTLEGVDNIIVDEASMLDFETCLELLKVLPSNCNITLLGDANQLPPVSLGFMFKEFVKMVPCGVLTKTHRQKCSDLIDKIQMKTIMEVGKYADLNADIILAFKNKTVDEINKTKQKQNPNKNVSKGYKIGDPVMFLTNDRQKIRRNNGDKGVVVGKDLVKFDDGMVVSIPNMKNVCLAYAITIHKSQGQQWENVHVIIDESEYLNKSLLYVGFSRCQTGLSISGCEKTYLETMKKSAENVVDILIGF
jgi:exodeoxyribonuclease V alpha subunit